MCKEVKNRQKINWQTRKTRLTWFQIPFFPYNVDPCKDTNYAILDDARRNRNFSYNNGYPSSSYPKVLHFDLLSYFIRTKICNFIVLYTYNTQHYWVYFFVQKTKNIFWRKEIQWKVWIVFIFLHQKTQ